MRGREREKDEERKEREEEGKREGKEQLASQWPIDIVREQTDGKPPSAIVKSHSRICREGKEKGKERNGTEMRWNEMKWNERKKWDKRGRKEGRDAHERGEGDERVSVIAQRSESAKPRMEGENNNKVDESEQSNQVNASIDVSIQEAGKEAIYSNGSLLRMRLLLRRESAKPRMEGENHNKIR